MPQQVSFVGTRQLNNQMNNARDLLALHGWSEVISQGGGGPISVASALARADHGAGTDLFLLALLRHRGVGPRWTAEGHEQGLPHADLIDLLATEITEAELVSFIGPQWALVLDLVRQVSTLDAGQAQAISWLGARDLRDGAGDGDGPVDSAAAAGRASAWHLISAAIRSAVARQSWTEGAESVSIAASGAACALIMRDLIGHYEMSGQDYRDLSSSWATAIGVVHADDMLDGLV